MSKNIMFLEVFFLMTFWRLFGRLLGGKSEENEVKIAFRRETLKKVDFSKSMVFLKEKHTFSRSDAEKNKKKHKMFSPTPDA